MPFPYKKTKYENLFDWHENSKAKCFYCNDKEDAPIALKLFADECGVCSSCLNNFEVGHLGVDRHVIEHIHPEFTDYKEAAAWFKELAEKGGCELYFAELIPLGDDDVSYQYHFVHDIETYQHSRKELAEKGHSPGIDYLDSYNTLEIHKDGSIHIVY